ncbi:Centrosomal protein of 78 kDa [Taenia crassiceps]|uniref:Centrosomal protein of 78 kDa n=1 Tax=Taenia crassiceps TaxID=6207 RepID=A0ABR4Q852_9CEST
MRHSQDRIVDVNIDNIRRKELDAVLRTLEVFPRTQTIAFRSLLYRKPNKRRDLSKAPKRLNSLMQPEVLTDICRSLLISATANQSLRMLELQNLPLACDDVVLLCQGLVKARNLRFLSFENSQIGDGAVTELCSALKRTLHVMALNLSGCSISDNGIRPIVNLLHVVVVDVTLAPVDDAEPWPNRSRPSSNQVEAMVEAIVDSLEVDNHVLPN